MSKKSMDGNAAAAHIAYAFSEVCALFPITPSSVMGELVDEWASKGRKNLFGKTVVVSEMQSEGGAAGALHGALAGGALASTFTASQGLLLMLPNMYKIAGELMPTVFHVTARALATHALSIFGDHQDVMAARATGFNFLCSNSVQEAMDLALVAHLASLKSSLPFLHFFDGFRTSHEIQKIEEISYDEIHKLVDYGDLEKHRRRALRPEHPHIRGTAQNPDIYFQAAEAANPYYRQVAGIVEEQMNKVFSLTGRQYNLFDYVGDKEAEDIIIAMGSAAEVIEETVNFLNQKKAKTGLLKVRLFRPFSKEHFLKALPASVKRIAVLDRTKENGAFGEPLFLEVSAVLKEAKKDCLVIGGRFGLGSKDFNPSMVKAVFDNLKRAESKSHFTVGITDDVGYLSLPVAEKIDTEPKARVCCKFWGLGGDGTVGANKDAIKIIGDNTDLFVQGYFAYDSKKSFGVTISHLRFGQEPIKSSYFVDRANFIACHQAAYVQKYDILEGIVEGGCFVLNSPWTLPEMEARLPNNLKRTIAQKHLKFYNIDAAALAKAVGLGSKINTVMQTAFFILSRVLPVEKALELLNQAVEKTYAKKGAEVVAKNQKAIKETAERLVEVKYPESWAQLAEEPPAIDPQRPQFVREVADLINRQKGDLLPVSAFAPGGVFPQETSKWEKRGVATELPKWIAENCIQCNQCAFVCPHAVIRPFLMTTEEKARQSAGGEVAASGLKAIGKGLENYLFSIEVSSLDCTGCGNCVEICPAPKGKALVMRPKEELETVQQKSFDYALGLPAKTLGLDPFSVKGSQFKKPLLEFSGACAGCGETPYVKLLTQLYGERMIVANATGCTSIWGGSAPSFPYALNETGCGPAWANSLFEDNAEFGYGMALAVETKREELRLLVEKALLEGVEERLKPLFSAWMEKKDDGAESQKLSGVIGEILQARVEKLKPTETLFEIWQRRDLLTKPSLWIIGGDGWAYDIGYGGLDHVLALGLDVNILVLDTEVYSNTGGQASKATPLGSVAKFAASGKKTMKKDLGLMAMTYGGVYVASVAMGADQNGLIRAFKEAESYRGPSLIVAYSSCISHGIKGGMLNSEKAAKEAVLSGYWFCYRFDPRLKLENKNPFQLDSKEPTLELEKFLDSQVRYDYLKKSNPEEAERLHARLKQKQKEKYLQLKALVEKSLF
ncbi:MAG: pyruvate:ferredoxin (flavodoxin) oxidoreductase [Parachlamydiales bacterium]|jgi:pyruvate-ferredoxin/flavodoxin oxidoreductase